ncbi:MAG: cytochrome c maturation protein CcmE domain-containing protein [Candidatus Cyclobacteriaceae bacterium M3_2C_046]
MKKTHIIGIVVIAVAMVIIISSVGDASTYVTFNEAKEMADYGNTKKIHVVGELTKDANGRVTGIQESPDKLSFTFDMIDENQNIQKVYYNEPVPTDFLRSEKVVIIGTYGKDIFVADKILMKCPSKYNETEVKAY